MELILQFKIFNYQIMRASPVILHILPVYEPNTKVQLKLIFRWVAAIIIHAINILNISIYVVDEYQEIMHVTCVGVWVWLVE